VPAKVALIGVTHPHSAMYLETLNELPEVTEVSLVDPDRMAADRIASTYQKTGAVYEDIASVLSQDDITHALVALPNNQTAATLVRLIDAGKNVFTEKPAARTAAEFEPVLAALARRPVAFTVAYLNRWHPTMQYMRELCRGGVLGRLTSVELRMVTTQVRLRNPRHWLFDHEASRGGILTWLGCHWLDLARFLTGEEVTSVSAQLARTSGEEITVEDTAAITFRTSGGAIGSFHAGYLLAQGTAGYRGASSDWAIHLRGTLGTVAYRRGAVEEPLVLETIAPGWQSAPRREINMPLPPSPGYGGVHGLEFFRAFLNAGPGDTSPAGAIDALRVLEMLDAIYDAESSGRTIAVTRRPE
jgi:predicted dehydrogenase